MNNHSNSSSSSKETTPSPPNSNRPSSSCSSLDYNPRNPDITSDRPIPASVPDRSHDKHHPRHFLELESYHNNLHTSIANQAGPYVRGVHLPSKDKQPRAEDNGPVSILKNACGVCEKCDGKGELKDVFNLEICPRCGLKLEKCKGTKGCVVRKVKFPDEKKWRR
ncbi:hypothetical protein BJ508DRAFT_35194 [Ascobolus immersus RN42]|uniref:Uncharacterized protein n=1 Tax=Ascobolus immersus RN42 TaxID=1160509 RepID=A0A3N4HQV7_ASCIM|nr:hypothetical protein BJ508DRAFT_35194 [Ascobolus immersus RN42]